MNSYEYIIAGLPVVSLDYNATDIPDFEELVSEIRDLLSASDKERMDLLLDGFNGESLNTEFYQKALKSGNVFLREYFKFDLAVRNAKVRYLNAALGRDKDMDVFLDLKEDFDEEKEVEAALAVTDIIGRERALDELMWRKIDELTVFDYFDIEAVLGFTAKFHIIVRWMKLDAETGRAMFRKLIGEVRGTFKGVEYEA